MALSEKEDTGEVFETKEELDNDISEKVPTNTSFAITAWHLRKTMKDIVATLWNKVVKNKYVKLDDFAWRSIALTVKEECLSSDVEDLKYVESLSCNFAVESSNYKDITLRIGGEVTIDGEQIIQGGRIALHDTNGNESAIEPCTSEHSNHYLLPETTKKSSLGYYDTLVVKSQLDAVESEIESAKIPYINEQERCSSLVTMVFCPKNISEEEKVDYIPEGYQEVNNGFVTGFKSGLNGLVGSYNMQILLVERIPSNS